MIRLLNATTAIAIVTFLWYRKGRLWNFYDSLLAESISQIKANSIDRKKWEEIALQQCSRLSQETFQSLFRFEVEYLKNVIRDHQHDFWIPDAEDIRGTRREYTDKEKFCKYHLAELFLSDLSFCGLKLFFCALYWHLTAEKNTDKGYEEKQL